MEIGVLKERKRDEGRVAVRPDQAAILVKEGHRVFVEQSAGVIAGFPDEQYRQVGASVVGQDEVYNIARLLLKVKCPLASEYGFLRPQHTLFTYLHFDENIPAPAIQQIVSTGVTGIAYEWVEQDGKFPLLQPMSELTGAVFARKSMDLLMGRAGLLGGQYLPFWPQCKAMVIGAGHIGVNAVNVFARNQFHVTVVDKSPQTLEARLARYGCLPQAVSEVVHFDESAVAESLDRLRRCLPAMDIVICSAVRRPTLDKDRCEYLLRGQDVATMKPNRLICDATACNRDFIETGVSSDSLTETYVAEGVIHYNCDHIPALVPQTSTWLLTDATFPYVRMLAGGFEAAVKGSQALARGVMCHRRNLTHAYSAKKKKLQYVSLDSLL